MRRVSETNSFDNLISAERKDQFLSSAVFTTAYLMEDMSPRVGAGIPRFQLLLLCILHNDASKSLLDGTIT